MNNHVVINVHRLSKQYHINDEHHRLLRNRLESFLSQPLTWLQQPKTKTPFWSLKNISFTVKQGEVTGIIGPNGAGKSTLLKILAGITIPTSGEVHITGKVGSLLEAGTGFHPDLTGRENIFLSGAILGIPRARIQRKFEQIVDFAGTEKFLDTPVKFYSSGMYVRLAFAVAAELEPDILLIDEILSVGDAEFQEKSLRRMETLVRDEQRTIILVSHTMELIRKLCDRVYLLDKGHIIAEGSATTIINKYHDSLGVSTVSTPRRWHRGTLHIVAGDTYHKVLEKTEVFDKSEAVVINQARLNHLESLNLPLTHKKVLDVGAGVGILAQFFVKKECNIVCIDAREKNVEELRRRWPHLKTKSFVVNVETDDVTPYGTVDIVFCYGLLYHVEKPELVLEKLGGICGEMLILESCITDHSEAFNLWVEETYAYNQALKGIGSRPTPSFIISALHRAGFPYVYFPKTPPQHPDFQFDYRGDLTHMRHDRPLRQIFIASKKELPHETLQLVSFRHTVGEPHRTHLTTLPFSIKSLSMLPRKKLITLAEQIYNPQPFLPIPSWFVGKLEHNESLRIPLRVIWETLMKSSRSTSTIHIRWYNDLKLRLYVGNEICRCVFVEGTYEPNELYFISQFLKPGMTVVDIGANIGIYTLFAASFVKNKGKVIAIEPSRREFIRLSEQVKLNRLSHVRLLNCGVGSPSSKNLLSIAKTGHEGHNTLGTFIDNTIRLQKRERIAIETVDNIVKKQKLKRVDFIKMDIEGAEYAAFQGATDTLRRHNPIVLFELSDKTLAPQGAHSGLIWQFLVKLAYGLYQFDRHTGRLKRATRPSYVVGENIVAIPRTKTKLLENL